MAHSWHTTRRPCRACGQLLRRRQAVGRRQPVKLSTPLERALECVNDTWCASMFSGAEQSDSKQTLSPRTGIEPPLVSILRFSRAKSTVARSSIMWSFRSVLQRCGVHTESILSKNIQGVNFYALRGTTESIRSIPAQKKPVAIRPKIMHCIQPTPPADMLYSTTRCSVTTSGI